MLHVKNALASLGLRRKMVPRCAFFVSAFVSGRDAIDGGSFCFQHSHGTPSAITDDIVGAGAIGERVLVENARPVIERPSGIAEKRVDLDAAECFALRHYETATGSSRLRSLHPTTLARIHQF